MHSPPCTPSPWRWRPSPTAASPARLLEGSDVACADLDTPDKLITHAQELRVFANALACTRDPAPGLSLGLRMHVSAYGILGYTMLASPTLRRHLQQLNTSFRRLPDEVRYDKARQLLVQTDLPIYLIAEQLGYSETASFRHAFQRWSGQSPSLYRR
ncbi:AraC family transcriptional regulator ligand-binding domain-containing protein [Pseudomonas sp. GCM10022186]|uniref:AraC family transcriptional regulator n=1 Tax=Pseudomonas sp. GCM10022186 TaxID=3252650 RepID=UPI0036201007